MLPLALALHGGAIQRHPLRALRRHRNLLPLLLLLATSVAIAKVYKRNDSCDAECSPDSHTCYACHYDVPETCPEGWTQEAQREQVDTASCKYTDCSTGGCPADRPHEEVERSQLCINPDLTQCYTLTCRQEFCCSTLTLSKCCKQVDCLEVYEDCQVPEQLSRSNSSSSQVHMSRLPHGATATFPFFKNLTVPSNQTCEKLWGSCSCTDGLLSPGCDASNSSSWTSLDHGPDPLPAGLSLTCSPVMDCQVPQRSSSDLGSGSNAVWGSALLPHGSHATFTFYLNSTVRGPDMCRPVYGHCSCDNGQLLPGCSPSTSSSWWALDNATASALLPPDLPVTCTVEEEDSGEDGGRGHGLVLAGVIVSLVLLLLGLCAAAWFFRAHLMLKTWAQLRLGSSYQPVQTGAPFSGAGDALGKYHNAGGLKRPSTSSGSRLRNSHDAGPSRPLPFSATPEDDVFTLEDLDHDHRDHYPVLPVSRKAEVELNTPRFSSAHHTLRPPAHAVHEKEASDKQPLLDPAAAAGPSSSHPRSHVPEVVVTLPVQLEVEEEEQEEQDEERGLMGSQERGLMGSQVVGKHVRRG